MDLTIYSCSRNHHCLDKQVKVSQILAGTQNLPTLSMDKLSKMPEMSKYLEQQEPTIGEVTVQSDCVKYNI